jgi:hypothetical protein
MLKKTKARIHFQICDGEPEMLAVVADRMAFGIGRLRLLPTSRSPSLCSLLIPGSEVWVMACRSCNSEAL